MVIRYPHTMQNIRAIRRIVIIAKNCMLTLLVAVIFFSAAAAQPEGAAGIAWTKTYPDCAYCEAHAITRTSDGGYLVTGTGEKASNRLGLLLLKTDSAGNEQWRTIDNGNSCEGNAVIAMLQGNATVTGGGCNTGTDAATLTVIEDTKGTVRQVWNFETGRHATGTALLSTADGGYLLLAEGDTRASGRNDRDLIISRIDAGETIAWTKIFSGPGNDTAK
ncbi:MAG: hypothetical protein Q8R70_12520, partial [Methanoregula sp.]|nr:hypothetical protein [Methanoregula sp.]